MRDLDNLDLEGDSDFDYSNLHHYGWDTSTHNDFTSKRIIVYLPFSLPASHSSQFFKKLQYTEKDLHIEFADSNDASKEAMDVLKMN